MTFRKIISLSIALSFIVLLVTGILSYLNVYSKVVASLHTVFGILFSLGVLFHFKNNFRQLKTYSRGKLLVLILLCLSLFFVGAYFQTTPFSDLMDLGASLKAKDSQELNYSEHELIEMNLKKEVQLSFDLRRAEHYWHPQMAIWVEDSLGNYVETLFVSKATAKGLFFGGRTKTNFKSFDEDKKNVKGYRRVNALPVWSYKRDVKYADGLNVPTRESPLPDAISGATLTDNFNLMTSVNYAKKFILKLELNVAFDDNEYYSEFDFPDDMVFHNGTGQLGQPSILFKAQIDMEDSKKYYLMELIGHGHRSGQNGSINSDLTKLTTALEIVERIVVGVKVKSDKLSNLY